MLTHHPREVKDLKSGKRSSDLFASLFISINMVYFIINSKQSNQVTATISDCFLNSFQITIPKRVDLLLFNLPPNLLVQV